ncbi:YidB family protein [Tumidithrix elongata RA019]|uniref:YidB family protein n=1 Tax=Tumidithrix elongata BACA0141 TaxID=2716417 RepID=A0AAW9PRT7_9CYAN|nr:YidB family protein [Tumidithrix elongata RA019]
MALFDDVLGMVGGKGGAEGTLGAISHLIDENGGLNGLLKKFNDSGLAAAASSWVGLGENQQLSAENIMQVLGNGKVQQLAQQFGIDQNQLASQIAGMLPQVIDKLTPDGTVPAGNDVLSQGLQLLKSSLFK